MWEFGMAVLTKTCHLFFSAAVMQTDGFDYLKECCPSVLTELLEYVARFSKHSVIINRSGNEGLLDGSDVHGRRVKQRLYENLLWVKILTNDL